MKYILTLLLLTGCTPPPAPASPIAGEWIQKIREHESEQNRTPIEDMLNNTLTEYEDGSDGSTKSEELLQFSSNEDSKSPRW